MMTKEHKVPLRDLQNLANGGNIEVPRAENKGPAQELGNPVTQGAFGAVERYNSEEHFLPAQAKIGRIQSSLIATDHSFTVEREELYIVDPVANLEHVEGENDLNVVESSASAASHEHSNQLPDLIPRESDDPRASQRPNPDEAQSKDLAASAEFVKSKVDQLIYDERHRKSRNNLREGSEMQVLETIEKDILNRTRHGTDDSSSGLDHMPDPDSRAQDADRGIEIVDARDEAIPGNTRQQRVPQRYQVARVGLIDNPTIRRNRLSSVDQSSEDSEVYFLAACIWSALLLIAVTLMCSLKKS